MTWKEIGPYRGHILWVREVPPESWLVGMVPDRAAPGKKSSRWPPAEDQVLPEAFPSEIAAVAAILQLLDQEQGRRNAPRPPSGVARQGGPAVPRWKLTPTGLPSDRWARSLFRGSAVVRAPDEAAARAHASLRFDLAAASPPASDPLGSPWQRAELVRCTRLEGAEDEETGPTAILDPPGYDW